MVVVGALLLGTLLYSQIHGLVEGFATYAHAGPSGLKQDGVVKRTVYPTILPRVDYELTGLGQKLAVPLRSCHDGAVGHRPAILAARHKLAKTSGFHITRGQLRQSKAARELSR